MRRLLTLLAGALGFALTPLGASTLTAWLLVPGHLLFTGAVAAAQVGDGLAGEGGSVRAWVAWYVLASAGAFATLQIGTWPEARAWWLPLAGAACWAWVPVAVAVFAGGLADRLADARSAAAVRRRHEEAAAHATRGARVVRPAHPTDSGLASG